MRKTIKIMLLIISFIFLFFIIIPNHTYADIDVDSFNPWDTQPDGIDGTTVTTYTNNIAGTLTTLGIIIAVLALMITGLGFIIASVTEKVDYKKRLVPIIIGILVIIFIINILNMLNSIGKSLG